MIKIKFQADFLKITLKTWRNIGEKTEKVVHERNLRIFCFSKQFLSKKRGFCRLSCVFLLKSYAKNADKKVSIKYRNQAPHEFLDCVTARRFLGAIQNGRFY